MKKIFITLCFIVAISTYFTQASAKEVWVNDLRNLYLSGNAIIYGINIRTFGAKDIDGDGIINESLGEEKGSFINAIDQLNDIAKCGINTINILPILPVGKKHALGTAGSLYAPSDFDKINPQLKSSKTSLSLEAEAMKFIEECHNRHIRVIVDLPAGASFDFFEDKPELILKNNMQQPLKIEGYSDIEFLDGGSETNINNKVYNIYNDFIKMIISLGADGVKVNFPELKPKAFWQKLITETRISEPQFLFLADNQLPKTSNDISILSLNSLLDAGFDGYFGHYNTYSQWIKPQELYNNIINDINISKKYNNLKKVTGNFATPFQQSPIIVNGKPQSEMIMWLQASLPMNSYFTDGFITGDNYRYPNANKKSHYSQTDDFRYYVNNGKIDIYNFSRKPKGEFNELKDVFVMSNNIKLASTKIEQKNNNFETYKTDNEETFAYGRILENMTLIAVGNLNFRKANTVSFKIKDYNKSKTLMPITTNTLPSISEDKFTVYLSPGEIFIGLIITLQTN